MKKLCLRILVALVGFAGLGVAAQAQVPDKLLLKFPSNSWSLAQHFQRVRTESVVCRTRHRKPLSSAAMKIMRV
jgi:hypothetical protein